MKKSFYYFLILSNLLLFSCSPSSEDAIKYNDSMIEEQLKIVSLFDSLNYCLDHNISQQLLPIQKKLINQIEESSKKINKFEDFDKNDNYKKNIEELFNVYNDIANNEYNKIINIYLLPDSLYTNEEEIKLNKFWDSAFNKVQNQLIEFNKFQEDFSKKYNFKLE
jgi:hypothetical protein